MTSAPIGVMLLKRRQPDALAAAPNKHCPVLTLYGLYTEFGIDPWTQAGFVYLSSVMDLFSRRIIAWSLSKTLDASLVVDAVNLAKARRNVTFPLILHSDRGCQYTSAAYREASAGFRLSYSKKGYPYDNACMEAFHSLIKREWLDRVLIRDFQHAYSLVFEYIETFYNTVRIHSHCGFLSPLSFESRSLLPRPS